MLEAVDGRGKLLDRPAEPLAFLSWMYLRCRGESPWLGSENHTCLTECPAVPGSSWELQCFTLTKRGLASTEFGKHRKQTPS